LEAFTWGAWRRSAAAAVLDVVGGLIGHLLPEERLDASTT